MASRSAQGTLPHTRAVERGFHCRTDANSQVVSRETVDRSLRPTALSRALAVSAITVGTAILVFGIFVALTTSYDTGRAVHVAVGLLWVVTGAIIGAAGVWSLRRR